MSREKQLEEMTQIIKKPCVELFNEAGEVAQHSTCPFPYECDECIAINLYKAGYRKQEWIGVEERLPEVDTNVLVITASGSFKVARCNIYKNGTLVLWATNDGLGERAITHWMPLPETPKGE